MGDRPELLDLFCGEGGAAAGYLRAGFEVTGVDSDHRRGRYYPGRFVHGDALEYVKELGARFAAVHASPPCQLYSITRHAHAVEHPDLIPATRAALEATGRPFVIENVPGAPLVSPITLCGAAFGLTATDDDGTRLVLRRHRLFESNVYLAPVECECLRFRDRGYRVAGAYGAGSSDSTYAREVRHGGYTPAAAIRAKLLGVEHRMTLHGLSQSIPPAYTEHLGAWLLDALR